MNKFKKTLSLLMALCMVMSLMSMSAFAANESSTDVQIEIKATGINTGAVDEDGNPIEPTQPDVSVTVPSVLPIVFNANGTETVPEFNISNLSENPMHISQIKMTGVGDWALAADHDAVRAMAANSKVVSFLVGFDEEDLRQIPVDGVLALADESLSLAANGLEGNVQCLYFDLGRTAFTEDQESGSAYTMAITFDWNVGNQA